MKVDAPADKAKESRKMIPEGDAYIKMLTQLVLLDSGRLDEAAKFSTSLVEDIHSQNRRTLDQIGAKIFFYYSRAYELLGDLSSIRPYIPRSFPLSMLCGLTYVQIHVISITYSYIALRHRYSRNTPNAPPPQLHPLQTLRSSRQTRLANPIPRIKRKQSLCEILVLFGPYPGDPIGLFGGSSTFVNGYSKGSATE